MKPKWKSLINLWRIKMHKINPAQDREEFEEGIDVLIDEDGDARIQIGDQFFYLDPREIKELYDYIQLDPRSNSILERFRS